MIIGIGADHRGYKLKQQLIRILEDNGYEVRDFGGDSEESSDYPDFAEALAREVSKKDIDYGILICSTGIGMSIAANKVDGAYAALVLDKEMAEAARSHNNANIIALSAEKIDAEKGWELFNTFISADFEGGRHERRYRKVKSIENG